MHHCLGEDCPRYITYRFAICTACEARYGRSSREWPAWLRFLWNETQRHRRAERRYRKQEIQIPYEA
jgi:hypothetical protein